MLVKIEARSLIFPGTDFHFPSTSVPPGTFLGSVKRRGFDSRDHSAYRQHGYAQKYRGKQSAGNPWSRSWKENEGYGGKDLRKRKVLNV